MPPATCTICDTPLTAFAPAGPPLCGALPCAWKYRTIPAYQRCQICGRVLSIPDQSIGACSGRSCWVALNQRRQQGRIAESEAEAEDLRDIALQHFPELRDRQIPITVIPAYHEKTRRVQQHRRDALRRRLAWVLQEANEKAAEPVDPSPVTIPETTGAAVQAACTSCRGHCCRNGNDHAYLTAATMHRVQADHPELSSDQITEAYLSHVGPRSYHNSCIYHSATGCGLPRAMRSDTCNNFFCDPMRGFLAAATRDPAAPAFLASIERHSIRAGVLFDGETVTIVRGKN